jgi:UDP-glucose:(heptosyl)LPS alpha-1,3-glucosyltransferase
MRLAFCLFKYFPYGGLQRDFLRIARAALARGHMVDVYTMEWDGRYEPGLAIHTVRIKSRLNHKRRAEFVRAIQPSLREGQYDLIVGFNKMPGLDVYYAADTCYQAKARIQHGWLYRLSGRYRATVAFENSVFAPGAKAQILLLAPRQKTEFMHFYNTPEERFHLLPPGIERDRIAPENAKQIRDMLREEYKISAADYLLLMVGSGFKTKGVDRTLQAIAALSPNIKSHTRLFVIGKDKSRLYEKLARKLKIANLVTFLGGRKDVPRFLLGADLLLHPAYNENTGTVILEAMAAGLPVIVSDVCGYARYVSEAAGGIVLPSPFSQERFNMALASLLASEELRSAAHVNGLAFSKDADIYSMPDRVVTFLESKR